MASVSSKAEALRQIAVLRRSDTINLVCLRAVEWPDRADLANKNSLCNRTRRLSNVVCVRVPFTLRASCL